ncbi:MAG: tyrosine-type recombinase/integrase, partial [Desulfotignum sp.]
VDQALTLMEAALDPSPKALRDMALAEVLYGSGLRVSEATNLDLDSSQSDTTRAMTENIGQVSAGIQEVNENVAQSSQVAGQVASEISDVLSASEKIRSLSDNVKQKAGTLDQVITRLRTMTQRFKL